MTDGQLILDRDCAGVRKQVAGLSLVTNAELGVAFHKSNDPIPLDLHCGETVGLLRQLRHRGGARGNWTFIFTAAAFNLVRMRTLLTQPA